MSDTPIIQIRRFDKTIALPEYKTEGAAGFDLATRETVTIPSREVVMVPLGVAIKVPSGFWTLLAARSSLFKRGVMPANALGVMDQDYSGNDDEFKTPLYNFTDQPVTIEKGERIMQVVLLPMTQLPIQEVEALDGPNRGAFGTTGNR